LALTLRLRVSDDPSLGSFPYIPWQPSHRSMQLNLLHLCQKLKNSE